MEFVYQDWDPVVHVPEKQIERRNMDLKVLRDEFPHIIQHNRILNNMTVSDVANEIGKDKFYVIDIEKGKLIPTPDVIQKIEVLFRIQI